MTAGVSQTDAVIRAIVDDLIVEAQASRERGGDSLWSREIAHTLRNMSINQIVAVTEHHAEAAAYERSADRVRRAFPAVFTNG